MTAHRKEYTVDSTGYGRIPLDWGQVGGVVLGAAGFYASCPGQPVAFECETLEEAWDMVESWRMMNGMNADGTPT